MKYVLCTVREEEIERGRGLPSPFKEEPEGVDMVATAMVTA
jgi:hypothetical protein